MEQKNLCALIPLNLHQKVTQGKETSDCQTLGEYITQVLTAYFEHIEHKGESTMNGTRTMAFQISEELFQRIKAHLAYESRHTGKKLTQRDFVLSLIEQALAEAAVTRGSEMAGVTDMERESE